MTKKIEAQIDHLLYLIFAVRINENETEASKLRAFYVKNAKNESLIPRIKNVEHIIDLANGPYRLYQETVLIAEFRLKTHQFDRQAEPAFDIEIFVDY